MTEHLPYLDISTTKLLNTTSMNHETGFWAYMEVRS